MTPSQSGVGVVLPRLTLRRPVTACARLCGWRLARSLWEMLREVRAVVGGEARLQSHRPVRQLARRVSRWGEVSLVLARPGAQHHHMITLCHLKAGSVL